MGATIIRFYLARYVFASLGCMGIMIIYSMRVNLSIAMVAMVNKTVVYSNNTAATECELNNITDPKISEITNQAAEFDWDEHVQAQIQGSFYWGYIMSQIPGGCLADRYSAKWVFGSSILASSSLYLLLPVVARAGYWYFIAIRILAGILEGPTFPTMQALLVNWSPLTERSRMTTIVYSGCSLGTVVMLPVSGLLISNGFDGGWPSTFYACGLAGILWSALWLVLVYDSPDKHPWMTQEERDYIMTSIEMPKKKSLQLPWCSVAKSLPMWAIAIGHFCHNWGGYTLLTELPTFLERVFHFSIKQNSLLSALPHLTAWIFSLICSAICDFILKKQYLSTTRTRHIFQFIGHGISALIFFSLTLAGCDKEVSLALLVMAMTVSSAAYSGFLCNHIDIASNYAATLMGITNTLATIPGWLGTYVVGQLTHGNQSIGQWCKIFYITAGLYLFSAIFYIIFGRAEEEPWNKLKISLYKDNINNAMKHPECGISIISGPEVNKVPINNSESSDIPTCRNGEPVVHDVESQQDTSSQEDKEPETTKM